MHYPIQTNYTAGELSPKLALRVDFNKYANGVETLENFVVLPHGGVTRAPGTRYVATTKDSTKQSRLVPFEFSTTQAYILEMGDQYFRFYKDSGQIESIPGTPVEVVSPYLEADLFDIKYAQSADVIYFVHPSYAPRKLTRTSHTAWTLTTVEFIDGPYFDQNLRLPNTPKVTSWTLTPSAATGDGIDLTVGPAKTITDAVDNGVGLIRITAASHGYKTGDRVWIGGIVGTTEANGEWTVTKITGNTFDLQGSAFVNAYVSDGTARPALFVSTDVGRLVRIKETGVWGYVIIATYTDGAHVTADVQNTLTNTTSKTVWRLGAWSDTTGYPGAITFIEDRLAFAGSTTQPQTVWGSITSDYEDMSPSATDGTVSDDSALTYTIAANQVNVIKWLSSAVGLLIGTVGGEFVMFGGNDAALSPTNVTVRRQSTRGSFGVAPVTVGTSTMFVQRAGRKIRELAFSADSGTYNTPDLTLLAEHLTSPSLVELSYQQEPNSIVWAVRSDGVLIAFTYNPDQEVVAFSTRDTEGLFESVASIPSPNQDGDQTWVLVNRSINGVDKRYVEVKDTTLYVDSGLTYSGIPETTLDGLDHLEGKTVDIVGDGAVYPQEIVSGGSVTLDGPAASEIQIGLHYTPRLVTLRPEVKMHNEGTSQGQPKHWAEVFVRLYQTLGLTIEGDELQFRVASDSMDEPPSVFTGDKRVSVSGWNDHGQLEFCQDQPLPVTILGHFGTLDVGGDGE